MSEPSDAVIVAGGQGTRLRPLTLRTPKPLLPLCGEPFLAGVLRRLAAYRVRRVFLVVGPDPGPFAVLEPVAEELGLHLEAVPEPEPLDTAGGVRAIAERLDGAAFVLNGDILTDLDLDLLVEAHRRAGADATLALVRVADTSAYGVAVRDGTRIVRFVEKPPPGTLPDQDTINAGTYLIEPEVLLDFPPGPLSFERDVFPGLLDRGAHLEGVVWEGVWADLGTPERYLAGHRLVLEGRLRWPSLELLPDRDGGCYVHPDAEVAGELIGPVAVGPGARIAEGALVGPHVVVGPRAVVGPGAVLRDAVLHEGAEVAAGAVLDGAIVGAGARIGRGVRVHGAAVVGPDVEVPSGAALPPGARVA